MRSAGARSGIATNAGDIRTGKLDLKCLLAGDPNSLANYNLLISRADTDFEVPRHLHNFEQIRLVLSGEVRYGKDKVLKQGGVAYFPEGVPYGPQVRVIGTELLTIQFGGASRNGYIGMEQLDQAQKELRDRGGVFENGAFIETDANGERQKTDSFQACWELVMGRPLAYPKPRYGDTVIMRPEAFDWRNDAEQLGVSFKWVGTFTECNTRLGFVRVKAGSTLNAGLHDSAEMLFLVTGKIVTPKDGLNYGARSAFGFDPKEGPIALKAIEDSEFFRLHLPKII